MEHPYISELFVDYYSKQGYKHLPSAPLLHPSIPMSFVMSAGLVQIETVLGNKTLEELTGSYVLTQSCFRHFDVNQIGQSDIHLSLFFMPGAFQFGEFNKHQAIHQMWYLLTEIIGLNKKALWVTYYDGRNSPYDFLEADEETKLTWQEIKVDSKRVVGRDATHNLWQQGGGIRNLERFRKCGANSEVFYDRGIEHSCGDDCLPGCECQRFVELANTLFVSHEYDNQTDRITPLPVPFVETVIGSERVAMIAQNQSSVFEIDAISPLMKIIEKHGDRNRPNFQKSQRIIADHTRALAYLVADGAPSPGKNGRHRIMRKLIRSLITQYLIHNIPIYSCVLESLEFLVNTTGPSGHSRWNNIVQKYIEEESQRFRKTISRGKRIFNEFLTVNNDQGLTGNQIVILEKRYGLPIDLVGHMLAEKGFPIPEQQYQVALSEWQFTSHW